MGGASPSRPPRRLATAGNGADGGGGGSARRRGALPPAAASATGRRRVPAVEGGFPTPPARRRVGEVAARARLAPPRRQREDAAARSCRASAAPLGHARRTSTSPAIAAAAAAVSSGCSCLACGCGPPPPPPTLSVRGSAVGWCLSPDPPRAGPDASRVQTRGLRGGGGHPLGGSRCRRRRPCPATRRPSAVSTRRTAARGWLCLHSEAAAVARLGPRGWEARTGNSGAARVGRRRRRWGPPLPPPAAGAPPGVPSTTHARLHLLPRRRSRYLPGLVCRRGSPPRLATARRCRRR